MLRVNRALPHRIRDSATLPDHSWAARSMRIGHSREVHPPVSLESRVVALTTGPAASSRFIVDARTRDYRVLPADRREPGE